MRQCVAYAYSISDLFLHSTYYLFPLAEYNQYFCISIAVSGPLSVHNMSMEQSLNIHVHCVPSIKKMQIHLSFDVKFDPAMTY